MSAFSESLPARWRQLRSVVGLALLTWGMTQTQPHPALHGRGLAVGATMVVASAGWLVMTVLPNRTRMLVVAVLVCGSASIALAALTRAGYALAYLAAACLAAGSSLSAPLAVTVSVALFTGYAVTGSVSGSSPPWLLGGAAAIGGALMAGVIRRQQVERAEQAELLLAETQLAREEQARAAALAERARIAREIHDVLAHALAALSVQLETADALLERGRSEQARATIGRARQLAREGLAETRRAISTLRGDPLALPELVGALVDGYALDTAAPVTLTVDGESRPLPANAGLALYRTAQEALTNVRKHAAGSPVCVRLSYGPGEVALDVVNDGPGDPALSPPAAIPGGYGLTGLRERAELAGGEFVAGPLPADAATEVPVRQSDDTPTGDASPAAAAWRVGVRIPG